ncbi:MAG: hypothetical protein EA397_17835 [Deltaproteobacteria bacterium]|nr:MAG: hypothetical protein EA397_17835 [Deltaproteobacteria bacterium]
MSRVTSTKLNMTSRLGLLDGPHDVLPPPTGPPGTTMRLHLFLLPFLGCSTFEEASEPDASSEELATDSYPDSDPHDGANADWTVLSAGRQHSCGIRYDGTLWCWGEGEYGRLGNNSTTSSPVPVQVLAADGGAGWSDWTTVSAGGFHTCGRRTNGTLWCWGHWRVVGDGSADGERATPSQVLQSGASIGGATWSDWTLVSAGSDHTCGLRANGTLWCWGYGSDGRRGDGSTVEDRATPAQVLQTGASVGGAAWSDWTAVSAGAWHTCGLRADGTLWCWGDGDNGQRGDGTRSDRRTTPAQVLASDAPEGGAAWSDWTTVSAGGFHTCGRRADGTLWCWGYGHHGQRGDGSTSNNRDTPSSVLQASEGGATWSDWTTVSAGHDFTCGHRTDGTLWCWGYGAYGRRGDGGTSWEHPIPAQVLESEASEGGAAWSDWTTVSAGRDHACGRRSDESFWCWGYGRFGQRGDGSTSWTRTTPIEVLGL